MKKLIVLLFLGSLCIRAVHSQHNRVEIDDKKMEWFHEAKLGIFIHWGIYAVHGVSESWSFFNNYMSHEDYMKQLDGFTAKNYNPAYWADLIAQSGAKYVVLTSRHHDGVALWDSKMGGCNVVQNTPAKKDLIAPLADAVRKKGIKFGLYYSLPDWSYNDYNVYTRDIRRYDIQKDTVRWNKFLKYMKGQLHELSVNYNPDLFWFDGDWEHNAKEWTSADIRKQLLAYNPATIINSRLNEYGDYATPEQGVPIARPASKYWELCMTINDSWGYQPHDNQYKSANQILRIFVDCITAGGNLLLDIGPKEDGTIDSRQVEVLTVLGQWIKTHQEAVYGIQAGLPDGYFYGKTALSMDKKTLYLYLDNIPAGEVSVKGLESNIKNVRLLRNNKTLAYKTKGNNTYIHVDKNDYDPNVSVIAIDFEQALQLY